MNNGRPYSTVPYSKKWFIKKNELKMLENYAKSIFRRFCNSSNFNSPLRVTYNDKDFKNFQKYFKSIKNRHNIISLKNKWNI